MLIAIVDFLFPYVEEPNKWNQKVYVYICWEWEGEPQESDEIKPKWFDINKLPFETMWSDAPLWIPKVIIHSKKCLKAGFLFDNNKKNPQVEDYYVMEVEAKELK